MDCNPKASLISNILCLWYWKGQNLILRVSHEKNWTFGTKVKSQCGVIVNTILWYIVLDSVPSGKAQTELIKKEVKRINQTRKWKTVVLIVDDLNSVFTKWWVSRAQTFRKRKKILSLNYSSLINFRTGMNFCPPLTSILKTAIIKNIFTR